MGLRNTDLGIQALARALDNARTSAEKSLFEKETQTPTSLPPAKDRTLTNAIERIQRQQRAERVSLLAIFIAILITIFAALTGNDQVVLYPDLWEIGPSSSISIIGWLVLVGLMGMSNRFLGWKGAKLTILFAIVGFPGVVLGSIELGQRIMIAQLFSNGSPHYFRDNLRIYGVNETHGRGGATYHVIVRPYGIRNDFEVVESDYRQIAAATGKQLGYPYCVSVIVEQVGIAVRALSPPYEIDPVRNIVRCPPGGLRSEDPRYTAIPTAR
jgi:hypothetical protein